MMIFPLCVFLITRSASLSANKLFCVCRGIRITLWCFCLCLIPLPSTMTLWSFYLAPPLLLPSPPLCSLFVWCLHTGGKYWMMPFSTSGWTSPFHLFLPGWQERMTSSRPSSTKLSLPRKSIIRAKVRNHLQAENTQINTVWSAKWWKCRKRHL